MSKKQIKSITVQDKTIVYELERKNVKNVNLRIRQNGTVYISTGPFVPNQFIEDFIRKKKDYIFSSIKRFEEIARYRPQPKQYVSGEAFYILGHELRLAVSQAAKQQVYSDGVYLYLFVRDTSDYASKRKAVQRYLDAQCRETFSSILLEVYPQFAKYGVSLPQLRIRNMETRWGSCLSKKGIITLNKHLLEAPRNCIEYVITHELCHFIHPNHSKQFYEMLTLFMPDWKNQKKILDERIHLL